MNLDLFPAEPVATEPAFKWIGGKRWLVRARPDAFPPRSKVRVYHEPFTGGGAVFFGVYAGHRARLSDTNPRLVNAYQQTLRAPDALIMALSEFAGQYNAAADKAHYYNTMRAELNHGAYGPVASAALFLFVLMTGFNGLWRVNKSGHCNTPHGDGTPANVDAARIRACSKALRNATVTEQDFEAALAHAVAGDFVFADPPYDPVSETASFTSYATGGFSWADRERLAKALVDLDARGARFTLTDSATHRARLLYAPWTVETVSARRSVNCDASKRGPVQELLVRNWS